MKKSPFSAEDVLGQCVPGFHQYILSEPASLCAVSPSLCEMTGCTRAELLGRGGDRYVTFVTSVVILVTRDEVENLSMFSKEYV